MDQTSQQPPEGEEAPTQYLKTRVARQVAQAFAAYAEAVKGAIESGGLSAAQAFEQAYREHIAPSLSARQAFDHLSGWHAPAPLEQSDSGIRPQLEQQQQEAGEPECESLCLYDSLSGLYIRELTPAEEQLYLSLANSRNNGDVDGRRFNVEQGLVYAKHPGELA